MKDFIKIFLVLITVVVAFVFGRSYGEQSILESKEFKDTKSNLADSARADEELKLMKDKFQSLLDSADLKKADEVYGKMMTLFLVDLGLRISEQQQKDLDAGKTQLLMCAAQSGQASTVKPVVAAQVSTPKALTEEAEAPKVQRFSQMPAGRFKSTEWTLVNSSSNSEILRNLEKVKLTDIDAFLKGAPQTGIADLQKYYGTFRGRVSAVDGSNYGSLVVEVGPAEKVNQVTGEVKFFREGKVQSNSAFTSDSWGYRPEGYQGNMVSMGDRYLQIYKIESSDKIAGNFYERLPNGTTKLIGSFVLNRTDRI